jgi:hypothetical protein
VGVWVSRMVSGWVDSVYVGGWVGGWVCRYVIHVCK